jgi:hypothetical protein
MFISACVLKNERIHNQLFKNRFSQKVASLPDKIVPPLFLPLSGIFAACFYFLPPMV